MAGGIVSLAALRKAAGLGKPFWVVIPACLRSVPAPRPVAGQSSLEGFPLYFLGEAMVVYCATGYEAQAWWFYLAVWRKFAPYSWC